MKIHKVKNCTIKYMVYDISKCFCNYQQSWKPLIWRLMLCKDYQNSACCDSCINYCSANKNSFRILLEGESQVIAPFFNIIFVKNKGFTFELFNSIVSPSLLIVSAIPVSAILIIFSNHQAPY